MPPDGPRLLSPVLFPKSLDRTTEPNADTPTFVTHLSTFNHDPPHRAVSLVLSVRQAITEREDSPLGPLLPDTLQSSPTLYAGRLFSIVILTTSTSSPAVTSIVIVNGPRVSSIGCRESTPVHEIVHAEDNGCTKNTGCSSSADND